VYLYEIQKEIWNWNLRRIKIKGAKILKEEYEKKIDLYAQRLKKL